MIFRYKRIVVRWLRSNVKIRVCKVIFIKDNMMRDKNTLGDEIKTSITTMIGRGTKVDIHR